MLTHGNSFIVINITAPKNGLHPLSGVEHEEEDKPGCPASGNTNADACYGVSDHDMQSVMGSGMQLRPEHAYRIILRSVACEDAATLSENLGGNEGQKARPHQTSTAMRHSMKKQAKSLRGAAFVVALVVAAWSCLPMSSAYAKKTAKCNTDAITQSVCIYQAILADVDKTYAMRGGCWIVSIAETSTWNYKVKISHDFHGVDHLDYTVKIGAGGKVEIVGKKESAENVEPQTKPGIW